MGKKAKTGPRSKLFIFSLIFFFAIAPISLFAQGQNNLQQNVDQKSVNAKIFLNSCLYGTMAGALVGTGSLAFADNPRGKLQRIFRGASLGLYAGILLGAYLVYGVEEGEPQNLDQQPTAQFGLPLIYPLIDETGIHGAGVDYTVLTF